MNNNHNITDPSDWQNSKFPKLAEFDSSLRCQICKEFLKSPVLTTCGHIFCSICIRRNLSVSQNCPLCHEETYESGLKKILLLDGIINWYEKNRVDLQNVLKIDNISDSQSDSSDHDGLQIDQNSTQCPICNKKMKIEELQSNHIDKCLTSSGTNTSTSIDSFFNQTQPKNIKSKQRLPNLDTSISTIKLKEKMNSLKLPVSGNRNQLEKRMKEFINLYNSNLDSLHPVNDFVLLNKLRNWENIVSTSSASPPPPKSSDQHDTKRQKIQHKSWNNEHSKQYNELIQQAKARMTKKSKQV